MNETGFGPGGYAQTPADIPAVPVLMGIMSEAVTLILGPDANQPHTEYAVNNETDGVYLDAAGMKGILPVWRTRSDWGTITARGLIPLTSYVFRVKARNQAEEETMFSPSVSAMTYQYAVHELSLEVAVCKASSTIAAPSFMSVLSPDIRLAGKDLNELGFNVDHISGLDVPRVVPDEELVPGDHAWHVWDEYFAPKRIVIEGIVHGSSPENLRLRLAYLKSFLATFEGNPWRSTAPVRLERSDLPDRFWTVYYDSIDTVETIGKRERSSSARVRVTMKCPLPYAASNEVVRTVFTPSAGTFTVLDLGNAPSEAVYVIEGAAVNPSFSVGDMVFHCDFSDGLAFTDVENVSGAGVFSPSGNEAGAYRTTETGTGILVNSSNTIEYTAKGNRLDGSWVVVFSPQWQSSSQSSDVVILEHRYDADNYLRLSWDASNDAWVFRKRAGGTDYEIASEAQAFVAGTRIILGITYDSTNAGGMKLFVDGLQAGIGGDTAVLAASPGTLTLHEGSGTLQPDVVFDMIAGWSRMLSADEMLKIASDPGSVVNLNTTVNYTGTLAEGDLLTLDSRCKTGELFDVSEGTRTNVLDALSGTMPALVPGRKRTASDRTQTVLYAKIAASRMEVRYRRYYL